MTDWHAHLAQDSSAFVKEAAEKAMQNLPQLAAEDFDIPQSV